MKEALILLGAIVDAVDNECPVTDGAKAECLKIRSYLEQMINSKRPDRAIHAYESIVSKLFAYTLRNGDRINPTGWANALAHTQRVTEERSTWAYSDPDWDHPDIVENLDPRWIKKLKGKNSHSVNASDDSDSSESEAAKGKSKSCRNFNSKRGCSFDGCRFPHEYTDCGKDGASMASKHKCKKQKR
jgi:hypothetical protein